MGEQEGSRESSRQRQRDGGAGGGASQREEEEWNTVRLGKPEADAEGEGLRKIL